MNRQSLTYGILPKIEDFNKAFDLACPTGYYKIENDKIVGTGKWFCDELWHLLVHLKIRWEQGSEEHGNLASQILSTLGFEWI